MNLVAKIKTYGSLVAFSHTVFAMPFAASAVVLSRAEEHTALTPLRVLAMIVCMVFARTAAMAFNRYADRDVDAANPRTKTRHIPSGAVKPKEALLLTVGASVVFLASAATLGFWPFILSPLVLAVVLGYSLAKRFTWGAHAWLGVALALAPGGAWLATGADPNLGIVCLMVAVMTWLLGFDTLYSLQDEAFDRDRGLHSIPARFGLTRALVISAVSHVVTVCALAATGIVLHRGLFFAAAVALAAAILTYEHVIVGKGNLAKINKAFFDANAWVSVGFFALVVVDEAVR